MVGPNPKKTRFCNRCKFEKKNIEMMTNGYRTLKDGTKVKAYRSYCKDCFKGQQHEKYEKRRIKEGTDIVICKKKLLKNPLRMLKLVYITLEEDYEQKEKLKQAIDILQEASFKRRKKHIKKSMEKKALECLIKKEDSDTNL